MRRNVLLITTLFFSLVMLAQNDPTIMTINGVPVLRSEFEYSYNKYNTCGVSDKKTVNEYADLFIDYKLKVAAALDAHCDTLASFKKDLALYRDQEILTSFVSDSDIEKEAMKFYNDKLMKVGVKGLIRPAHIFIHLSQKANDAEKVAAQNRIDSIYDLLKNGADFADLARKYSEDDTSSKGGLLPWISPGQTLKEFEDQAYSLKKGEMSKPFLSTQGYHIILMKDKKALESYDSLKTGIVKQLEMRGIREYIANEKLDSIAKQSHSDLSKEDLIKKISLDMSGNDVQFKNLMTEFHDGLLLYEISNRVVWDKASKDEQGLHKFFKKNKKRYKWDSPRFKGIVYHVTNQFDKKAVVNCIKKVPFSDWNEKLASTFNKSIIRVKAEKGIFKQGDNPFIDKLIFKKAVTTSNLKDYPIDATYGKMLKNSPQSYDDVRDLVIADYQDEMEKQWVKELHKKYVVSVNQKVLETVNTHNK